MRRNSRIPKRALTLFLMIPCAWAQTAVVTSVNQTGAVLQLRDTAGECAYASTPRGASVDDSLRWKDGTRVAVVSGLAASADYRLSITGCATLTVPFSTLTLTNGTTLMRPPPFDPGKWGNLGYPSLDWTQRKTYIDPMTGVKMIPLNIGNDWSWRTGCGPEGCASASEAFTDYAGGAHWSNPSHILSGADADARASTTDPIEVFPDPLHNPSGPIEPWGPHRTLEDLALVLWGGGNDAVAENRQINVCMFLNRGDRGCKGATLTIALPRGSVKAVGSGSKDPDQPWPAAFPSTNFAGWGVLLRNENYETGGTLDASGGALTIRNPNPQSHFSDQLGSGSRIYIAGSAPACTNNLCTVAAYADAGHVRIAENLTISGAAYRAYGFGFRIAKTNATGTVTIGVKYKMAGSGPPLGVQSLGDHCSPVQVRSGDGKPGNVCELTSASTGTDFAYFLANDGTVRRFSNFVLPRSGWAMPAVDRPDSLQNNVSAHFGFDAADGKVFYVALRNSNSASGWSLYKLTYTGDFTADQDYAYTCGPGGDCPDTFRSQFSWVNLMPPSQRLDLNQQIQANQGGSLPAYNASVYGPWLPRNTNVSFFGSSGHYGYFQNVYAGQGGMNSGGPGWVAEVDLKTGKVTRLIHTVDGTGCTNCRWGSFHSAQASDYPPGSLFLSLDRLQANNSGTLHGGPFNAAVTGVLRNGAWSGDTALHTLPGSGYDNACPANAYGATTPNCVTLRLPQGGVCNIAPTAAENSTWPCPWNRNFAQPFPLKVGDLFTDYRDGKAYTDEEFRILAIATEADRQLRIVAQRNAVPDYSCLTGTGPTCVDQPSQFEHANGWILEMYPGSLNSTLGGAFLIDSASGHINELGALFGGHFSVGAGANGTVNFATAPYAKFGTPFDRLANIPTQFKTLGIPAFHRVSANIGAGSAPQSYTHNGQYNAGEAGFAWMLDTNGLLGCTAEALGCGFAARTLTHQTGDVYRLTVVGTLDYKVFPLNGQAGRYLLHDVSGPSSSVDATPFSMCYAKVKGECHSGSMAGEVYVNVPYAYDDGANCDAGLSWAKVPCVVSGLPAPGGGIRRQRISADDKDGAHSQFVSYAYSNPLRQGPYCHAMVHPSGMWFVMSGCNPVDGRWPVGWMVSLPPWQDNSLPANDFVPVPVQLSAGMRYARIKFGYREYGGPTQFYCTARTEACVTDRVANPFAFVATDTLAPANSCASGCTIQIPTLSGRILYYQEERSADGTVFQPSKEIIALQTP